MLIHTARQHVPILGKRDVSTGENGLYDFDRVKSGFYLDLLGHD